MKLKELLEVLNSYNDIIIKQTIDDFSFEKERIRNGSSILKNKKFLSNEVIKVLTDSYGYTYITIEN